MRKTTDNIFFYIIRNSLVIKHVLFDIFQRKLMQFIYWTLLKGYEIGKVTPPPLSPLKLYLFNKTDKYMYMWDRNKS